MKKELTEESVYDIITELSQISDRKKTVFYINCQKIKNTVDKLSEM